MAANKRLSPERTSAYVFTGSTSTSGCNNAPSGVFTRQEVPVSLREYSGVVTSNFANVKHLPWNPFRMNKVTITPSLVETKLRTVYDYDPSWCTSNSSFHGKKLWFEGLNTAQLLSHDPDAENSCSERLQKQFNSVPFNAGMFIAERQQFIDMVGATARRLVHASRSIKRLRFGDAARALGIRSFKLRDEQRLINIARKAATGLPRAKHPEQYLASTWLEFQYGWQPLLSDVYGAAELLGSRLRSDEFSNVKLASAKSTKSWGEVYINVNLGVTQPNAAQFSLQTKCKYAVTFKTTDEVQQAFAVTGISNPLVLAWEVVPFSFVVDWFLPVGNFLEQLSAYNGFEISNINRMRFTKGQLDMTHAHQAAGREWWGYWTQSGAGRGSMQSVLYERDSIGKPAFVPLEFKDPVSIVHAANALALLTSIFGKRTF